MLLKCKSLPNLGGQIVLRDDQGNIFKKPLYCTSIGSLYRPIGVTALLSEKSLLKLLFLIRCDILDGFSPRAIYVDLDIMEIIDSKIESDWKLINFSETILTIGPCIISNLENLHDKLRNNDQSTLQEFLNRTNI